MILNKPLNRRSFTVVASAVMLLAFPAAGLSDTEGSSGFEALNAQAIPVRIQAQLQPLVVAEEQEAAQTCTLGDANTCFTPVTSPANGTYLNVGAFFDRRKVSTSSHYFVKLFEPDGTGRLEVRGLGYYSRSSRASQNIMQAAGVIKTPRANPIFPKPEQLLELQAVSIVGERPPTETCVEFSAGEVVLEADESAWLILRFPDTPDSVVVDVLADSDSEDLPCDFMTRDGGELWFRPDPYHKPPSFDWAITAYTQPLPAKTLREEAWTLVKRHYR